MKKAFLIFGAAIITLPALAQEKVVVTALTSLKEHNYDDAKTNIDIAMQNPETKEKPKALFAKAQIYFQMQNIDKYASTNPYREGSKALIKLVEVKPDYEKSTVDQLLLASGYMYFNDGIKAYNAKNLAESSEYMKNVIKIHDLKRSDKKAFDTIAAQANQVLATSTYYLNNYDEAIPLLTAAKNNPITKTVAIYECLIDAYNKQKKSAEAYATIQEARAAYPEDATLRNAELNYFIASGKQDELLKKLEEAAAKEPNNADIQFNLATLYLGLANPKDGKKPANSADLMAKAEDAYKKALAVAPDNPVYNFNIGASYSNQASDLNEQMNAITGTSDADQKKYDAIKAQRDAMFAKALPYLEKTYSVLDPKAASLQGEEKSVYKNVIPALTQIYSIQNKMDKVAELKKKAQ